MKSLKCYLEMHFEALSGEIMLVDRMGFPGGASSEEPTCQYRRHKRPGFDPLVGKIPWRGKWPPTAVFLP